MFIIAGENLIDLVAGPDGAFAPHEGGAPYNFARALALQGVDAGYVNPFSSDRFGAALRRTLLASGAHHLGPTSGRPTSLALVTTDDHGQPSYSFYRDNVADRDLDLDRVLASARGAIGFHTGALALVPPDHETVLQAMARCRADGMLCTVDVNLRPQVAHGTGVPLDRYRDAALAAVGAAHVVKVSDEDLRNLGFSEPPVTAARTLLDRGCQLVVLTLGGAGAWVIDAVRQIHQEAIPVAIVDMVGAGDCFFAGFLAYLHRHGALQELIHRSPSEDLLFGAMRHAAVSAAIDIARAGCQPPTWDEVTSYRSTYEMK